MESNYDEDLSENVFFQFLQHEHYDIFEKAILEGWVICVPRAGSLPRYALSHNDFFSHILIPSDELPETHFRSLSGKSVQISNRVVTIEPNDITTPFSTHILFEETYYNEDMLKYKVLCIENPLEQYSSTIRTESGIVSVYTLRDCIDLLWTESSKEILEKMDDHIRLFLSSNNNLEFKTLQVQKDLVGDLYTQCLQVALKDSRLNEKTSMNRHLLDNVKVSVESYVHHGIYKKLIKGVTACTAYEDANFNKIVRNLSDIQLRDLDIRLDLYETVPKARSEIARVEGYSTVLGKIGCLKRTISAITKQETKDSQGNVVAADDLLPMLVFLVIKAGLPNWIAHLTYMKEFSCASSHYLSDQHNFLVTSLEAAVEHIKNGLLIGPAEPESQMNYDYDTNGTEATLCEKEETDESSLSYLFNMVRIGNLNDVRRVLEQKETRINTSKTIDLCHPLCSCDKCEREISLDLCNTAPTVNSCDDRGFTVLHIAAIYGRPKVIDLLLPLGANPNKSDYKGSTAIHYAASRGHQNALLLLAHAGSKINQLDNEGNTPLHYASSNGHEVCVKALLYFAERVGMDFNINHKNKYGDTPLHNAARWGYEGIVSILLEYGANPGLENKRKLTPMDCAHNLHISQLLARISSKQTINLASIHQKNKSDIIVAAATRKGLDFSEEDLKHDSPKKITVGVRPNSTDGIKKVERLLQAITYGDIRLACFYLGLEPNTHSVDISNSCHPLCSCKKKNEEGGHFFGDTKVKDPLNVNVCNSEGLTPLHFSALYGRTELVSLLIEVGADINIQSRVNNITPLHLACQNRRHRIVKMLLDTGACDLNCQDTQGNTPLHYACQTTDSKLVELLMHHRPKLNIQNKDRKTPLDEAKDMMALTLVKLLTDSSLENSN